MGLRIFLFPRHERCACCTLFSLLAGVQQVRALRGKQRAIKIKNKKKTARESLVSSRFFLFIFSRALSPKSLEEAIHFWTAVAAIWYFPDRWSSGMAALSTLYFIYLFIFLRTQMNICDKLQNRIFRSSRSLDGYFLITFLSSCF